MILRVTQYGEQILKKKGDRVREFNASLKELAKDMIETMHANDGAGLAAQQVGHALQLFVMDIGRDADVGDFDYSLDGREPPLNLIMPMVVCNPCIRVCSDDEILSEEGCLSFPGMRLDNVPRAERISMDYQDVEGNPHTFECSDFLARCCLHEFDHLQGVLFTERVPKPSLLKVETQLKKLKRQARDFLKEQKKG